MTVSKVYYNKMTTIINKNNNVKSVFPVYKFIISFVCVNWLKRQRDFLFMYTSVTMFSFLFYFIIIVVNFVRSCYFKRFNFMSHLLILFIVMVSTIQSYIFVSRNSKCSCYDRTNFTNWFPKFIQYLMDTSNRYS